MEQDATYIDSKQFVRSIQKVGQKNQKKKKTLALLDKI